MSIIEEELKEQGEDLSFEHSQHSEKIPLRCYECHKESQPLNVDQKNTGEFSNLRELKESIKAQHEAREAREKEAREKQIPLQKREYLQAPEVTIESGSEFNLERHTQLCKRVDVLYNNYLVSIENFQIASQDFTKMYEELIGEGMKVRF